MGVRKVHSQCIKKDGSVFVVAGKEKAPLNETGVNGTVTKTGCADRDRSTYLPYRKYDRIL